jgi:transposase
MAIGAAHREPDLTLRAVAELAERGTPASYGAVWRFFKYEGITFKKSLHASEQDRAYIAPAGRGGRRIRACQRRSVLPRSADRRRLDDPSRSAGGAVIRLGELVMILDLHRQGLSVSAIARQLGRDRKTVRKYIERGLELPAYGPRQPRPTMVTPFAPYLRERIAAFPELTGSRLLREIKVLIPEQVGH